MSPTTRPIRASGWISPAALAHALDVNVDYVRRALVPRLPSEAVRRDGRRVLLHGRSAIEFWVRGRLYREALKAARQEHAAEVAAAKVRELESIETLMLLGYGGPVS